MYGYVRRLLLAVGGGLLGPFLVFLAAEAVGRHVNEAAALFLLDLIVWPLRVLRPLFSNPHECVSYYPTAGALLATAFIDFTTFSLAAYQILRRLGVGEESEERAVVLGLGQGSPAR
jgi:hypothetical protein